MAKMPKWEGSKADEAADKKGKAKMMAKAKAEKSGKKAAATKKKRHEKE